MLAYGPGCDEAGHWFILLNYSNAINTSERAEVLEDLAKRATGLALFVEMCYGGTPATSSKKWTLDSGEAFSPRLVFTREICS